MTDIDRWTKWTKYLPKINDSQRKAVSDYLGQGLNEAKDALAGKRAVPWRLSPWTVKEYLRTADATVTAGRDGLGVQAVRILALRRVLPVVWKRFLVLAISGVVALAVLLSVLLPSGLGEGSDRLPANESVQTASDSPTTSEGIVDPGMDPNDLAKQPGINPDFVAAMKADRYIASRAASDPRWRRYTTSRYPDGTFIPALGPCRGIDIPNPFTGEIIATSTKECESRRGGALPSRNK